MVSISEHLAYNWNRESWVPQLTQESLQRDARSDSERTLWMTWLTSTSWGSEKAVFSTGRAQAIVESIPLNRILDLSEVQLDRIRDRLTAFDLFTDDEWVGAMADIQKIAIPEQDWYIVKNLTVDGLHEKEDLFVLAKIQALQLKWYPDAEALFKVFQNQINVRQVSSIQNLLNEASQKFRRVISTDSHIISTHNETIEIIISEKPMEEKRLVGILDGFRELYRAM